MAEIHAACFAPADRWGEDAMRLQIEPKIAFGFIHPEGGLVLARAVGGEAEVLTLAVAPSIRRQGVGRSLLERAMAEAAARGAAAILLEVATDNAPARTLYASAGFVVVGRRPRYYPGGGDAAIMRAVLDPSAATTEQ
jgi:ribosomal-protein-alanine N-acetyltransferase